MLCFTGQVIPAEKMGIIGYIRAAHTGYLRLLWKTREALNERAQDNMVNKVVGFFLKLETLPVGFETQGLLMTRFMSRTPNTCSQKFPFMLEWCTCRSSTSTSQFSVFLFNQTCSRIQSERQNTLNVCNIKRSGIFIILSDTLRVSLSFSGRLVRHAVQTSESACSAFTFAEPRKYICNTENLSTCICFTQYT